MPLRHRHSPHQTGGLQWRCAMLVSERQRKTPDFSGVFRVADTFRYLYMVEVGGEVSKDL